MLKYLFLLFLGVVASDYCSDSLPEHNKYRALHKSPPLKCSAEISKVAQEYADKLAVNCDFKHSGNSKYGENLYMNGASSEAPTESASAIKSVKSWYDEEKCYDYSKPGFTSCKATTECKNCVVGHFTAVVWKKTIEIGVGAAKCKTKQGKFFKTVVVANYKEPGNSQGQFPEQVLKP